MPVPEKQLYKYVSFRIWKSGWVALVHANGKRTGVGGIHETQLAAATAAAKFLKVPVQDLRRQQPEPWPGNQSAAVSSTDQQSSGPKAGKKKLGVKKAPGKKKYRYKKGTRFRVAVDRVYIGSFRTAAAAAAAAAEYSKSRLVLKKEGRGRPGRPRVRPRVRPGELLDRLQAGLKVFHGYEPPDLENLALETKLSSRLWQSEPALPFLCALGKYGPWRAKLRARAQIWFSPGNPYSRPQDLPSRTEVLLNILEGTVEDMQSVARSLMSSVSDQV